MGGACNQKFVADTFEEIAEMSKKHGMEMFQKGDKAHIEAMQEMQSLMQSDDSMAKWIASKRNEFNALPESE